MKWELQLRRLTVGQRMAFVLGLLLLPMAVLSVVSVIVLNDQELAFRDTVEESITTLLPLTTLEHYLQRALVDEMEAQQDQSVPNFAALADTIDRSFASIESLGPGSDPALGEIQAAEKAWLSARPSVRRLIENARSLRAVADPNGEARTRAELQSAIDDVGRARRQLTGVVKARYARAVAERHAQLRWLVLGWLLTLSVAAALVAVFLRSLLGPIRELGRAARRLGDGTPGVRVPVSGNDELSVLAERFNAMAAEWESSRQSLLVEAAQDPLTGALNRRGALAALEAQLANHARTGASLAVFMIDLDRFKAINDRHGHSAGDRALVWTVTRMRQLLREGDLLGRYGGDEFIAVLPHTTFEQACSIADRMAASIGEAAARDGTRPAVSIGVAATAEHGWEATALIDAADRMLYGDRQCRRAGESDVTPRSG